MFYQRSEPIKSTLTVLTGHGTISMALSAYFQMFSDIFSFDVNTCELKLTMDYFDKSHKEKMRSFLDASSNELTTNRDNLKTDIINDNVSVPLDTQFPPNLA